MAALHLCKRTVVWIVDLIFSSPTHGLTLQYVQFLADVHFSLFSILITFFNYSICTQLKGNVSFFLRGYEVSIIFFSALHRNKMLTMTDNIHCFWIPLVALWIYGKDLTMGDQFARSLEEIRREVLSLIELWQRLYILDNSGSAVVWYRWERKVERDAEVVRSRERDLLVMTPTSENCALSLAAVISVLSCVLLQGALAGVVGDFNHAERCKDSVNGHSSPRVPQQLL